MTGRERGRFIVFEGIDASGKSTQANRLAQYLEAEGVAVHLTAEPTNGPIGSLIRQAFSGRVTMDDRVIAALFVADRIDHLTNERDGILRFLEEGVTVISDRYYMSSLAYHSGDVDMEWVVQANTISTSLLRPDLTIYLDLAPAVAAKRLKDRRGPTDRFEVDDRLYVAHRDYSRALASVESGETIASVNADNDPALVFRDVKAATMSFFSSAPVVRHAHAMGRME